MKIIIVKQSVEDYVDRILEACLDTAVGVPEECLDTYDGIEMYNKDNDMESEYVWLGMWMFDRGINFDKEIGKYCKKFNTHGRDASYKLLTRWYKQKQHETQLAFEELDRDLQ